MSLMTRVGCGSLVALVVLTLAAAASAQESKSAPLAKELAAALDAAKLDSIAAKDPSAPDLFVAALYFPGTQLLVVSAKYSVPQLLNERLTKREYRDVYLDLNGASVPDTKVFIDGQPAKAEDLKADMKIKVTNKKGDQQAITRIDAQSKAKNEAQPKANNGALPKAKNNEAPPPQP